MGSVDSDAPIDTEFLLSILDKYAKEHDALLVEEAGVKLGQALENEKDKVKSLESEVQKLMAELKESEERNARLSKEVAIQKEQK